MHEHRGRALFGAPLSEGSLARFIYTDEAGTSQHETVRVVASVIVHGDSELRQAAIEMENVFDKHVPKAQRDGFYFHATEVFSGGKNISRSDWSLTDRLEFLKDFVSIPYRMGLPVAVGAVHSGTFDNDPDIQTKKNKYQFEHCMAFVTCMERSDAFLRKYLRDEEIGTVICEDVPRMKSLLKIAFAAYKANPTILLPNDQRPAYVNTVLGKPIEPVQTEIRNIVDVPHFVEKSGAPLLQLADASAFVFRRWMEKKRFGRDLAEAALGPYSGEQVLDDPVWFSKRNGGIFNTQKYRT